MKLLFLEQQPRFTGGSERMSLALCQHAIARGHRVALVYAASGDMVDAYRRAGADCHHLPVLPMAVRRPATAWRSFRTLTSVVRREQTDVLFTSQTAYVPLLSAAGLWTGARTTAHLGLVLPDAHPLSRAGRYAIDLGVAPSAHTADDLKVAGWPDRKLRVIANGVDTTTFRPGDRQAARARLGIPEADRPLVAYVGRLVVEKGILTLLRAYARYRRAGGGGSLLFVGNAPGDEVAALGRAARDERLDDHAWSVRRSTPTPEVVYRAADLVVMPSEWDEPYGLVALEAAACGTLVIVSNRGVLSDFVAPLAGHGTLPAGDVGALERRLAYWLNHRDERESAAAMLSGYVRSHYAFERCGDAYLEAFRSLLERAPGRRARLAQT
jgi:glycosyltransferase involved in cell wall biosynthesis